MVIQNMNNLLEARSKISEVIGDGDNVIVAVDFKNGFIECVAPVRLNRNGDCLNEGEIISELKLFNCHPRKFKKIPLPTVFDTSRIIKLKQIA